MDHEPISGEEYVASGGLVCPWCKSGEIVGEDVSIEAGGAGQECGCNACGKRWWDVYKLTGYEEMD